MQNQIERFDESFEKKYCYLWASQGAPVKNNPPNYIVPIQK